MSASTCDAERCGAMPSPDSMLKTGCDRPKGHFPANVHASGLYGWKVLGADFITNPAPRAWVMEDALNESEAEAATLRAQRDEARALKVPPTVEELNLARMEVAVVRAERDRLTGPEMRERIEGIVRAAVIKRPGNAEDWDNIVSEGADAIMSLLRGEGR